MKGGSAAGEGSAKVERASVRAERLRRINGSGGWREGETRRQGDKESISFRRPVGGRSQFTHPIRYETVPLPAPVSWATGSRAGGRVVGADPSPRRGAGRTATA